MNNMITYYLLHIFLEQFHMNNKIDIEKWPVEMKHCSHQNQEQKCTNIDDYIINDIIKDVMFVWGTCTLFSHSFLKISKI